MDIKRMFTKLKWMLYYKYKYLKDVDDNGNYTLYQKCLMFLHISYCTFINEEYWSTKRIKTKIESDPDKISDIIYNMLIKDNPCMIARYGSIEQTVVSNYLAIKSGRKSITHCITGKQLYWWWDKKARRELVTNAGFFPNETHVIEKYCQLMISDTKQLDILVTWFGKEPLITGDVKNLTQIGLNEAEPWWQTNPWTRYLKNKKVLVVHPFAELIESQYKKRDKLFKNQEVLPEFYLRTIKAVQSIGGQGGQFRTWFEALEWMKNEMNKKDYDIALIGCGAYGFCLAAHAKSCGKKAIHMAGALQLLFGIIGARWEDPKYHPKFNYRLLFNKHWVRPDEKYKPKGAELVENSCYW